MLVRVRLAPLLASLAGGASMIELELPDGSTVADALEHLGADHPAVGRRVRDEQGAVRRHVNVFVGSDNIRDLAELDTVLADGAEIAIRPAISGG